MGFQHQLQAAIGPELPAALISPAVVAAIAVEEQLLLQAALGALAQAARFAVGLGFEVGHHQFAAFAGVPLIAICGYVGGLLEGKGAVEAHPFAGAEAQEITDLLGREGDGTGGGLAHGRHSFSP